MPPRRLWMPRALRALALGVTYVVLASFSPVAAAPEPAASPLARLRAGNDRFVRGTPGATSRGLSATGEPPLAMVLSCADQRVAPEHIFSTAPGELYVVRSLGEVVDRAVLGSLEHGIAELHAPLLVVMGHESCAAVQAAHRDGGTGSANLDYLLEAIRAGSPHTPAEQRDLRAAILGNVEQVINDALGGSPLLQRAVEHGQLQVVGAYYELASGRVVFSDAVGATAAVASR